MTRVSVYVVLVDLEDYPKVVDKIKQHPCHELRDGIWFMTSEQDTTADVADELGIDQDNPGIVVAAKFHFGFAPTALVEKLTSWNA